MNMTIATNIQRVTTFNKNVLILIVILAVLVLLTYTVEHLDFSITNLGKALAGVIGVVIVLGVSMASNKFINTSVIYKYQYNLALGGYVEYDVIIHDNNHDITRKEIIPIYKNLRNDMKKINFNDSRENIEKNIEDTIKVFLKQKYKINVDVDAIINAN